MKKGMMVFAVISSLGFTNMASAEVYQCPGAEGKVVFQQLPCPGSKALDEPIEAIQAAERQALESEEQKRAAAVAKRQHDALLADVKATLAEEADRNYQQALETDCPMAEKAKQGEIWVGMKDSCAIIARGHPSKINKTHGAWGVDEQWVYSDFPAVSRYLYLRNGNVTGWQTSR